MDYVEITSYVPSTYTDHFADRVELLRAIDRRASTRLAALVPNRIGLEHAERDRADGHGVDAVGLIVSASHHHSLLNLRRSVDEALAEAELVAQRATAAGFHVYCYLSTAFGYQKALDTRSEVRRIAHRLSDMGVGEIVLSDTTGVAMRSSVHQVLADIELPPERLFLHMHNHMGLALTNCVAAWRAGVNGFDATLGGVGGYPSSLAKNSRLLDHGGNVDTVSLLKALSADGGLLDHIDVEKLADAMEFLSSVEEVKAWSRRR